MRERNSTNSTKRGCGPLRDGMSVTYTDIRETLAAIAKAHKRAKVQRDRRIERLSATRNKGVR